MGALPFIVKVTNPKLAQAQENQEAHQADEEPKPEERVGS
jgi:hypothetical protein